jgi:hypothetical protein
MVIKPLVMEYEWLIGGLEHVDYLSIQLGISSSQLTNSIISQRGRAQPPTRFDLITKHRDLSTKHQDL